MNRNMSVYLDLLRLVAALGVFIGHSRQMLAPSIPVILGGNASQSVAIFFVLSGLVIAFVVDVKEKDWRPYARARALRMYSVTILALVITLLVDHIGLGLSAGTYSASRNFNANTSLTDVFTYLSFTHEVWWQHRWVGSNEAFWSLGYEVPYYFIFGLATFAPKYIRWLAVALVCAAIGPRVIAYFPLWFLGVWYYRRFMKGSGSNDISRSKGMILFVGSIVLYGIVRFVIRVPIYNIFIWKGLESAAISWLHFHAVGVCVLLNLLGFQALTREKDIWSAKAVQIIRWTAGGSFTLYLVHQPLMLFASAIYPGVKNGALSGFAAMLIILLAAYGIAELGERRKRLISGWLGRLYPNPKVA